MDPRCSDATRIQLGHFALQVLAAFVTEIHVLTATAHVPNRHTHAVSLFLFVFVFVCVWYNTGSYLLTLQSYQCISSVLCLDCAVFALNLVFIP